MNKVKRYIEACHICLKMKLKYMKNSPVYGRIPIDYTPMQDLSIDIKTMPQAFEGYHLLLVIKPILQSQYHSEIELLRL